MLFFFIATRDDLFDLIIFSIALEELLSYSLLQILL